MDKIIPENFYRKSDRTGWRGLTVFSLAPGIMPEPRPDSVTARDGAVAVLQIETYKRDRGGIVSNASCARKGGGFTTFEIFGDYSRELIRSPERCTEKTVKAQHERAVAMVAAVIEEAREYYIRKAAGVSYRERYAGLNEPAAQLSA